MKRVKFPKAGSYGRANVRAPLIVIEQDGDVKNISDEDAKYLIDNKTSIEILGDVKESEAEEVSEPKSDGPSNNPVLTSSNPNPSQNNAGKKPWEK
jgi:hypothetical protein